MCLSCSFAFYQFRRTTDHAHYGDEAGVGSIISPSIFTDYGLTNRDLLTLRNKQDVSLFSSTV